MSGHRKWRWEDTIVVIFLISCLVGAVYVAHWDREHGAQQMALRAAAHPYRCGAVEWTFEASEDGRPLMVHWHWLIYRGDMFVCDRYAREVVDWKWMQRSPKLWREWGFARGQMAADNVARHGVR